MTNLLAKTTEPGVLQFGLSMLNFIGLHGASRAKMCRYLFGVSWISANVILPKAILGSGKEEFDSVARSVAEMIFFCDACIAIAIFVNRRTSFEQMRLLLEAIFERYKSAECLEEIRRYKRRMDYFAKGYVAYIVFLLVPFLIAPILWTLCLAVFFAEENRNDYILVVEVQFYYLDIRRNIFHYLIYFCCCFPAVLCSAYQSSIKATVFLTSLQYGTKLFDLIHLRIKSLNSLEAGEERREELRQIIELHKMTLKYTQLLEETITLILINQMLNCVAIWCLMMVYLSTNYGPNAVNVAVLFIVLMGEMVFYCVNGTRLSENAQNVSNAIYNYQWYYESVGMQRDFRFMIQRAQQPTGVTAAKFYFVNIERLGIVMQASYSYYLLLKSQF
ncbi:odorant receptor 63a-like [Armigeres subalbatus]|uniref:odorant receptor 63a-like n=1 Tax=Armigeres subalbatus TaxID=124917 RepID=UPI002ED16D9C